LPRVNRGKAAAARGPEAWGEENLVVTRKKLR